MRIIAGSRKGHTIQAPKGLDTRPTSDRTREAAFNLIGPLEGARVLDLYAGSGAMGLEALSRGASQAVFVESDRAACRTIEQNLDRLRLTGAVVVCRDAARALAADAVARQRYDLILVDPPYRLFSDVEPLLSRYVPAVLTEDGIVVVETSEREEPELALPKRTSRRYGSARLTVFEAA